MDKFFKPNRVIVIGDIQEVVDEIMTLTNQKLVTHMWSDDGNSVMQVVDQITKIPIIVNQDLLDRWETITSLSPKNKKIIEQFKNERWDQSTFRLFGLKKRDLYYRLIAYRDGYQLRKDHEDRERLQFQYEKQASEPVYGQTGSARLNR
jgi:hypothetical protein